jgi:transglutaminase-like putative cysteine protease
MRFRIVHTTRYRYSQPVTLCHNEVHLRPRSDAHQTCESHQLNVEPGASRCHERIDYFGNPLACFAVQEEHEALVVTAASTVRLTPRPLPEFAGSIAWDELPQGLRSDAGEATLLAREMVLDSPLASASRELREYAAPSFPAGRPLLAAVADLVARIHHDFAYSPAFTTVSTPLSEVLAHRRGVCQDFAHLGIGCLRSLELPARYVSGYVESQPPPGQPRQEGADASHAWFAVYEPRHGWVDFDPTNNRVGTDRHISTACGRDYADVTPLKGVIFGGGAHTLQVSVDVQAIDATDGGAQPG